MSGLAVWTGVIGAGVGGGVAYLISLGQNRPTRSEGAAGRTHDREMRLWDSRAAAYVKVLDYAGRLIGWMENIQGEASRVNARTVIKGGYVRSSDEEWFTMMANLRAFGTDSALQALIDLHSAATALNGLIEANQTKGSVGADDILAACPPIHDAAVNLRTCITNDLQSSAALTHRD